MNVIQALARVFFVAGVVFSGLSTNVLAQGDAAKKTTLDLKKYQYLSIVLPQSKPDGDAARLAYYKEAFPLGSEFGLKQEMALKVDHVIISDYGPSGAIFYSYPNKASEVALANHPKWPAIKAQRPKAWEQLKIYSAEIEEDIRINFNPDKSYTLVIAWLNPENPDDYATYLESIEPMLAEAGGRFVYKMKQPAFEAHEPVGTAPGQLTFVEWDTLEGFSELRRNDAYKAVSHYITSGTSRIEFYRLSVPES